MITLLETMVKYEGHPKSKQRLRIQSAHLFCCSWSLDSSIQCDIENCLMQLYVGPCHVERGKCRDNCGHGCVDWKSRQMWGSTCCSFSAGRWELSHGIVLLHDDARPYTGRQTQALPRKEFYCDIFEHPPYSPDLAPSEIFVFPKIKENLAGKRFANDEDLKDDARWSHVMKRLYKNWC